MGEQKREAQRLKNELTKMQMEQIRKANEPDPYLQKIMKLNSDVVDWSTGANGIKDIAKHPTLATKLPVWQTALMNRNAGLVGRGVSGIGGLSDTGYAKDLALEDTYKRNMQAAGALETGLAGELDNAQRTLMGVVGQDTDRTRSANSLMQNFYADVSKQAAAPSGWGAFGKGLLKYGLPIAMSAMAGGMSGSGGMLSGLGGSAAGAAAGGGGGGGNAFGTRFFS